MKKTMMVLTAGSAVLGVAYVLVASVLLINGLCRPFDL